MNKKLLLFFIVSVVVTANLFVSQVFAQNNEYTVLAPLPGTTLTENCVAGDLNCKTTLEKYLPGMFNLLIGLAAVIAVLRIVWGGFLYMSTDALQGKEDGKNMVWNAVKGLVLVIGAWLILYTINPALLTLKLGIESVEIPTPAGGGGTLGGEGGVPMTDAEFAASEAVKTALGRGGVIPRTGPCRYGQVRDCVNLNGLTNTTQSALIALKSACGTSCNVVITGGTEGGHSVGSDHGRGTAVDLAPDAKLNSTVTNNFAQGLSPCQRYPYGGGTYMWEPRGSLCGGTVPSSADHWHASF